MSDRELPRRSRPMITGPTPATIMAPSGQVYDFSAGGMILIAPEDFAAVNQYYYEHYRDYAALDPGSWCSYPESGQRHEAARTTAKGRDVWVCVRCENVLIKNVNGWWTVSP